MSLPSITQQLSQLTNYINWAIDGARVGTFYRMQEIAGKITQIYWQLAFGGENKVYLATQQALQAMAMSQQYSSEFSQGMLVLNADIKQQVTHVVLSLYDKLNQIVNDIKSMISNAIHQALPTIVNPITSALNVVEGVLTDQVQSVKAMVSASFDGIVSNITDGFKQFEDVLTPLILGVKDVVRDTVAVIPETLIKLLSDLFLEEVPD